VLCVAPHRNNNNNNNKNNNNNNKHKNRRISTREYEEIQPSVMKNGANNN